MTKQEKLLESIRNHPKSVRFDDAYNVAEQLGFPGKVAKGRIGFMAGWMGLCY